MNLKEENAFLNTCVMFSWNFTISVLCLAYTMHEIHNKWGQREKEKVIWILLVFFSLSFQQHFSVYARSYQISASKARRGAHDLLEQRTVLRHHPE